MSANAASLYGKQYASTVQLLLQQKGSRLRKAVMVGSHKGDQASPVDQVGAIEMQQVLSRFGAIGRVDAAVARRWCSPSDFDLPQFMDSFDELKIFSDPKGQYVQNAIHAAGRQMDRLIIDAFFDNALTGVSGSTSVSFSTDGGNQIAVNYGASGNVGLTVAKLREAKRILMAANVDLDSDPAFCGINAKAHDSLLGEIQVQSLDYNERPTLVEGRVMRFMGFDFIHTELFENNATPYRRIPVWVKSGMHLGIWNEPQVDVSERKDLTSIPWQAYLKMSMGATRLEGAKVVEILCNEA